jgi:hypothetical protein
MINTTIHPGEPVMLPGRSFGRQARSVAGYSLATAVMIFTPVLVFVPAALFHCAIRNGKKAAVIAALIAMTLAGLYVVNAPAPTADVAKMAWAYVAAVCLALVVPSMAAFPLVARGEKFGRVLVFLLTGSIAGLMVTEAGSRALLEFSPYAMQVAQAEQKGAEMVQLYRDNKMPAEMVRLAEQWIGYSTFVLPAMILVNVTLVFMLSLLMLGRLKAWRELAAHRGGGDTLGAYLFRNFSLPDWVLFAFLLGGLTPVATGLVQKIAANTLAIAAFLYILQGLAIFRFVLVSMGAGFAGSMLGWLLLLFLTLTGVGPLLLGVAGLFDPFFDFRHFKKRKDDSHESHSD